MDELRFLVKEYDWLVVSNMAFIFNNIWDVILPIDELIFFKMVKTTNQMNMGVSINGYPNSWMVYFMESPIQMDDLGVPPFQETSISCWIINDDFCGS